MPSRDDDLDWLYGREKSAPSAPEPTQVMPGLGGADRGPRAAGSPAAPAADPWAAQRAERSAPYPPAAGSAPSRAAQPGRPDAAQYGAVPAYGQGARAPQGYADRRAGGAGQPPGPRAPSSPGARPPKLPRRKHPVRNVFLVLAVLVLACATWLVAVPLHAWGSVARVDDTPSGERPGAQPGTTFLLVGSDSRQGLSSEERKKLGTGNAAGGRTDSMMLLYIPPSGRPALISIPRDSYVSIPGNGKNKINAAFAFGGPKLLVKTVEQSTGLRVDGYMEIGFGGFVSIIDALGGIDMCIPKAIKDQDSHLDLKKGCQTLNGTNALGYVRMRHADPLGDLGRVQRQRQMLAAIAKEAATPSTVLNPVKYWDLTHSFAGAITVGQDTSLAETTRMALAMRKVASGQGLTLTVPVANANLSTPVGSAVQWDSTKAKDMFGDLARGDTADLDKYAK